MSKSIVIDGHAHACGEYLTAAQIENKLTAAGADIVLLTPGQYGSKTTYKEALQQLGKLVKRGKDSYWKNPEFLFILWAMGINVVI